MDLIQVREKSASRQKRREVARRVLEITAPRGVPVVINDDVRLAAELPVAGVHLGQDDLSFAEARQLLGRDAIIGLSTHNRDQTAAACAEGPSYIGVGPVFATPTKKVPDPVM